MTAAQQTAIRVYFEDTDFSGHVYHGAYVRFLERGRTEFLRDLGIHHSELIRDGIAFAVRAMHIDFAAAARIDDLLTVVTEVGAFTGARLTLKQTILRDAKVLTSAEVIVAAIKIGGGAARMPPDLRARLSTDTQD